jgi:hypothetical protein
LARSKLRCVDLRVLSWRISCWQWPRSSDVTGSDVSTKQIELASQGVRSDLRINRVNSRRQGLPYKIVAGGKAKFAVACMAESSTESPQSSVFCCCGHSSGTNLHLRCCQSTPMAATIALAASPRPGSVGRSGSNAETHAWSTSMRNRIRWLRAGLNLALLLVGIQTPCFYSTSLIPRKGWSPWG